MRIAMYTHTVHQYHVHRIPIVNVLMPLSFHVGIMWKVSPLQITTQIENMDSTDQQSEQKDDAET